MKLSGDGSKIIRSARKAQVAPADFTGCCCCECEECDGDALYDDIWPQWYNVTLGTSQVCTLICATNLVTPPETTFQSWIRITNTTGTEGTLSGTYKACRKISGPSIAPFPEDHRAFYSCYVGPAAERLTFNRYTSGTCATTVTPSDFHLFVRFQILYRDTLNAGWTVSNITTAVRSGNVVTLTTSAAHNQLSGGCVKVSGVSPSGDTDFNGDFVLTGVPSSTTMTYAQTADDDTGSGGTVNGPHIIDVTGGFDVRHVSDGELWKYQLPSPTSVAFTTRHGLHDMSTSAGAANRTPALGSFTRACNTALPCGTGIRCNTYTLTPCNVI